MRIAPEIGAVFVVKTFRLPLKDPRTKLPAWLVRKFHARPGEALYFQLERGEVVVTAYAPQRGNVLFHIRIGGDSRPRLTEVHLKGIGATFGDELEFKFIGRGKAIVRVRQQKTEKKEQQHIFLLPEEVEGSRTYIEGAIKQITVNAFERDPKARQACIDHYGVICCVCRFNFEEFYGEIGRDYIHVHHLTPISSVAKEYELDPIQDLRPVCPNCHAMMHRRRPPYTIKEMQRILKDARSPQLSKR